MDFIGSNSSITIYQNSEHIFDFYVRCYERTTKVLHNSIQLIILLVKKRIDLSYMTTQTPLPEDWINIKIIITKRISQCELWSIRLLMGMQQKYDNKELNFKVPESMVTFTFSEIRIEQLHKYSGEQLLSLSLSICTVMNHLDRSTLSFSPNIVQRMK